MKKNILFLIGILLGCIPIYKSLGWIVFFNQNPELSQLEKVDKFYKEILFGINDFLSIIQVHLIVIFIGFISIFIFSRFLYQLNRKDIENKTKKVYKIIYLALLIIISLFTFTNIFSIL